MAFANGHSANSRPIRHPHLKQYIEITMPANAPNGPRSTIPTGHPTNATLGGNNIRAQPPLGRTTTLVEILKGAGVFSVLTLLNFMGNADPEGVGLLIHIAAGCDGNDEDGDFAVVDRVDDA